MQIVIEIPKAVLFDTKYTVEQATNFSKKEFLEEVNRWRRQSLTNLLKKGMIKNDRTTETCEACSPERFLRKPFAICGKAMIKSHSKAIKDCEK